MILLTTKRRRPPLFGCWYSCIRGPHHLYAIGLRDYSYGAGFRRQDANKFIYHSVGERYICGPRLLHFSSPSVARLTKSSKVSYTTGVVRIGSVERKQNDISKCTPTSSLLIPSGYVSEMLFIENNPNDINKYSASEPFQRSQFGNGSLHSQQKSFGTEQTTINSLDAESTYESHPDSESMQILYGHLEWMMRNDNMGHDVLLIGPPGDGCIYRRRLALLYAELVKRPVEIVTLSSDTTAESDLKQRRELGTNTTTTTTTTTTTNTNNNNNNHSKSTLSSLVNLDSQQNYIQQLQVKQQPQAIQQSFTQQWFHDQGPVRAAIEGRILILDGLHTVDRNVLPTINNLLENREMNLDDGRCLVSPKRYQELLQFNQNNNSRGNVITDAMLDHLVPTHPDFRVIALAVPVPPYHNIGRALDPPLRSRFQIRRVDNPLPSFTSTARIFPKQTTVMTTSTNSEAADHSQVQRSHYEEATVDNSNGNLKYEEKSQIQILKFASTMHHFCELEHQRGESSNNGKRTLSFPSLSSIPAVTKLALTFPSENKATLLQRYYPVARTNQIPDEYNNSTTSSPRSKQWKNTQRATSITDQPKSSTTCGAFDLACEYANILPHDTPTTVTDYEIVNIRHGSQTNTSQLLTTVPTAEVTLQCITSNSNNSINGSQDFNQVKTKSSSGKTVTINVPCGQGKLINSLGGGDTASASTTLGGLSSFIFVPTLESRQVLAAMIQEHFVNRDILLLSPKGFGKSKLAMVFAQLLGFNDNKPNSTATRTSAVHTFGLYQDMTSRDLLMRRSTAADTNSTTTVWEESPLIHAAMCGDICILDGIEKLRPDVLATLHSLTNERDIALPDGRRLVRQDRYDTAIMRRQQQYQDQQQNKQIAGDASATLTINKSHLNGNDILVPIPASFRIIALGSTTNTTSSIPDKFLTEATMSMFSTIRIPPPCMESLRSMLDAYLTNDDRERQQDQQKYERALLDPLLRLYQLLQTKSTSANMMSDVSDIGSFSTNSTATLSLRNLIRIVRLVRHRYYSDNEDGRDNGQQDDNYTYYTGNLHRVISSVFMKQLLPPKQREALDVILTQCGIVAPTSTKRRSFEFSSRSGQKHDSSSYLIQIDDISNIIRIGSVVLKRNSIVQRPGMVPSPFFFDIPQHVTLISTLLQEWSIMGERSFLLIGNQGVGKNKIMDRLCQVANIEREYMQLHRDSTIGQLTSSPSFEQGRIVWNDSPLVRAIRHGCAIVIDEADKAPLETIGILKNLIEDGELLLPDGRRICRSIGKTVSDDGIIPIHPDFTIWILANRPGFPFHGNNLFREIGDCLSAHIVPNPDPESELSLLRSYAPDVNVSLLRQIVTAFDELRQLSEQGEFSYPYSTREAVSVAKHLQSKDDIESALRNVLDMDSFDIPLYTKLREVFHRNGIPMTDHSELSLLLPKISDNTPGKDLRRRLEILYNDTDRSEEGKSTNPPPLTNPKTGKWDENNDPHVGGNQWQGGTGGSDTAGLGGRGGPYRLDRGHKIHQVSDEAKAQVSEEARNAARLIAEKGLADRLREIGMSEREWKMYASIVDPIRNDISNLRGLLTSLEEVQTERKWLKRQSHGEIDDSRIVDGLAGENLIYKRRGYADPDIGSHLDHKKRIRFVMDCSASMYRFNSYDERLNRSLEAAALIMESFIGMDSRFEYSIVGHSGDSDCIPFVDFGKPPRTDLDRMKILHSMVAHTQYCSSGDNTLTALHRAMKDTQPNSTGNDITNDNAFVICISDANLERYGIRPKELGAIMRGQSLGNNAVGSIPKAFCIFIASFGDEAMEIKRDLPVGRAYVCSNTTELPRIVREILSTIA